jgi:predicted outer membrane repeat protein
LSIDVYLTMFRFFFCTSLICFCLVSSQILGIDLSGGNVSGVWTVDDSPFVVNGDLRVAEGESLLIEPGVEVRFNGGYKLSILGSFHAQGAAENPITFTSNTGANVWKGFRLDSLAASSDSARFEHCTIEKMFQQGIFILKDRVRFDHCTIRDNQSLYVGSIYMALSNPVIRNCHFENNNTGSQSEGGAMYIWDASPLIENNTFINNSATYSGGAISIYRGDVATQPQIVNNRFENNQAASGGAIVIHSNCVPLMEGNEFIGNSATYDGGAIWAGYVLAGEIQFLNNHFENNTANSDGGALYFVEVRARFTNTLWQGNSCTSQGGAFYADDYAQLVIEDSRFIGNDGNQSGGLYINDHTSLDMNRCEFLNNTGNSGAAFSPTYYCEVNVANTVFANNESAGNAGAVRIVQFCPVNFNNCVFANNKAGNDGGVFTLYWDSDPIFRNCIFWGNRDGEGVSTYWVNEYIWHTCEASFLNCVVEGGTDTFVFGDSNFIAYDNCLETDPLFLIPSAGIGADADASATWWNVDEENSPCLDAGLFVDGMYLGETDLAGNTRMLSTIDIGAYEGGGSILPPQAISIEGNLEICNGSDLELLAEAESQAPYDVEWFNNDTSIGTTALLQLENPAAGAYYFIASNVAGEVYSDTLLLSFEETPILNKSITNDCTLEGSGAIELALEEPFQNASIFYEDEMMGNALELNALGEGVYSFVVESANGCLYQEEAEVLAPSTVLNLDLTASGATCFDCEDGEVLWSATGGFGEVTLTSPANTNNLSAGLYTFCVEDELACIQCEEISVNVYFSAIDLNEDGMVNGADLLSFVANFGCTGADCQGDFNQDGAVNAGDMVLFLSMFN